MSDSVHHSFTSRSHTHVHIILTDQNSQRMMPRFQWDTHTGALLTTYTHTRREPCRHHSSRTQDRLQRKSGFISRSFCCMIHSSRSCSALNDRTHRSATVPPASTTASVTAKKCSFGPCRPNHQTDQIIRQTWSTCRPNHQTDQSIRQTKSSDRPKHQTTEPHRETKTGR